METAARLVDVEKTYEVGDLRVRAVRGVTLDIHAGAFLALVGPSGSGKTTLLNLIGALDTPTAGNIWIGDAATAGLSSTDLADFRNTHLGFVFQSFNLVPVLTAAENVALPLQLQGITDKTDRNKRVQTVLDDVGIGELGDRLPSELSGGQQQRVAIARALVKKPTLVLADEPTANLDSTTAEEIIAIMEAMNRQHGTTFVFSTHDPLVMKHATRVVHLRDGKIEAEETASGGAYA